MNQDIELNDMDCLNNNYNLIYFIIYVKDIFFNR